MLFLPYFWKKIATKHKIYQCITNPIFDIPLSIVVSKSQKILLCFDTIAGDLFLKNDVCTILTFLGKIQISKGGRCVNAFIYKKEKKSPWPMKQCSEYWLILYQLTRFMCHHTYTFVNKKKLCYMIQY